MILEQIVEEKKKRLIEEKKSISLQEMRELAKGEQYRSKHLFYNALAKKGLSIIGEFKNASPSVGKMKDKLNLEKRIEEYNDSVDAISCLTEESFFFGNIQYLQEIRRLSSLPILRKDFMIDEYQFYEAKVIGADAVLLITAILDDIQMQDFYQIATELELDVLVEVHNEREVERALKIEPEILGINNRNLKDFSIDLSTTEKLAKQIPKDRILVAESGILTDEDVDFLRKSGVDAFLVGRALMEAEHPKEVAARWKQND